MGLLEVLGLKQSKAKAGASAGPAPMKRGEGETLLNAATAYAKALADAQATIDQLSDSRLAKAKAAIAAKVITPARALAKAGSYDGAIAKLGEAAVEVQSARDFLAARVAAESARTTLGARQYVSHVQPELAAAARKIVAAQGKADVLDWVGAGAALIEAQTACRDGEGFLRQYAPTRAKSAEVVMLIVAVQNSGLDHVAWLQNERAQADALADIPGRKYADAMAKYDAALTAYERELTNLYVAPLKKFVKDGRAKTGAAFVEPELQRIEALVVQIEAAIAAHAWRKAVTSYAEADNVAFTFNRLIDRRAAFDAERTLTVAAIEGLKARRSLLGQVISLNKMLAKADALASRETMEIEDGTAALQEIGSTCRQLVTVADDSAAYVTARDTSAAGLAALEKHAAADKIANEIEALRAQFAAAAKLAGDIDPAGGRGIVQSDAGSQDFKAASARLVQLDADIAAARKVADGLGGLTAVEGAAGGKADVKSATAALEALRKDLAATRLAPNADKIDKELKTVDEGVAAAAKSIEAKKYQDAVDRLVVSAQALADARRRQIESTRNADLIDALGKQMTALSKTPEGAKIAGRIEPVTTLTARAAALDAKGDFVQSLVLLRRAEVAAEEAVAAAAARKAYDAQARRVADNAKLPAYASVKKDLEDAGAAAGTAADAFDFAAAAKLLTAAENKLKSKDIEKASGGATPNVADITKKAKEMVAEGAEKELDALIARLPESTKASVLEALAEARFGIKMSEEAGGSDGKHAMAVQGMCSLMAKVPADVLKNPSLKQISRKGSRPFPFYQAGQNAIVMNSRPGEYDNPMFPKKPANMSDAEWKQKEKERRAKILPGDLEESCQPANDKPEDYFDFNFLHEVAHAIDDARQFMAAREKKAEFGGWISHGGDLDDIGRAVAKAKGFDKTAEQTAYVIALINHSQADVPPRDAVEGAAFDAAKAAVDAWYAAATSENVWENQSLVGVLDIGGRVYHMAYSDSRQWVSYLRSARSRGITGYQFRAPGEWFSELYAAFKSGKLKKNHPSHTWLAELSI